MKKTLYSIIGALGILGLLSGCATRVENPTPEQAQAFTNKVNATAVLLENVTYSALVIIADKNPKEIDNVLAYANLAQTAVRTLIDNNNVAPDELQKALAAIPTDAFKSVEAQLIVPTVSSAYSLWVAQGPSNWYNSDKNYVARTFLNGVLRGVQNAVKNLSKVKAQKSAYRSLWVE